MKNYLDFSGKNVIVTGSRGIGRAIALAFAERGARLAVIARSPEPPKLLEELQTVGAPAYYFPCNLADAEARRGLIAAIVERMGAEPDILVNNAGFQFSETIETCTEDHWRKSAAVLLDAPYDLSRQVIPFMKLRRGGRIINIASICAFREGGWNFSYGVMKGGLVAMTRCMANAVGKYQINVNAIAPGIIRTDLTEGQGCFLPDHYQNIIRKYPLGRLGEPEEIAAAALFLGGDMSTFVTGQTLIVDGGFCGY